MSNDPTGKTSMLFTPITIKNTTLRNRLVISPMCQYSSTDGFATDWHLVHLGSRAVGGAALVMQEATAVSPHARISASDLGIYNDDHIEKLRSIVDFIHDQGAVAGIQLAHAGRKASCAVPWKGGRQISSTAGGWKTVGPSSVAYHNGEEAPEELSKENIEKVYCDFVAATQRALTAGYKIIEIHAAHGYLAHQFLSPLSNFRKDEYGGSFENRIRFLLELLTEVKSVWPAANPLFVRISATDWAEGGWDEREASQLAGILKQRGVDLIDCSSGGLVPHQKIALGPGYQVPFSSHIKKENDILTGAVGLITEPDQAESILQAHDADLIFIARESLRNPYFPLSAAKQLGSETEWPVQYVRAKS